MKISKRDFIKKASLGSCACVLGVDGIASGLVKGTSFSTLDQLWKWSTPARYFIETPRGVKCLLCPNECVVEPDKPGDCRTRITVDGKLYSIAYGNPCSLHVDPIEKKPLYHFLPTSRAYSLATAGCNLACLNCQNWQISQVSPRDTRNYDLMPEGVYLQAKKYNCQSIAYTYSEPIVYYEYVYDSAKIAKKHGVKNVLVSAGFIKEKPLKDLVSYIDGANIDLKAFDNEIYMRLNGGELQPVLDTLKTLKDNGVWLEITNLIVPEWTDDLDMIQKMCKWLSQNGFKDFPLHFSRFHPLYKLTQLPPTPELTLKKAREIALSEGLNHVYIGNVPGSEGQNTYCTNCKKTVIERNGYRILQNKIENGKCSSCSTTIAGVWD